MNKRLTVENFGYQDFILIEGDQDEVLEALKCVISDLEAAEQPPKQTSYSAGHLIKSLLNRTPFRAPSDHEQTTKTPAFTIHNGHSLWSMERITTESGPAFCEVEFASPAEPYQDDIRLSSIYCSDWVLIEYREQMSDISTLGAALSTKFENRDVLYFRRSGDLICEYHNDFHVYQRGQAKRRVKCHSTWPGGDIERERWDSTLDGDLSPYEPEMLYRKFGKMDLLDNEKLEQILDRLGLSSQKLFARGLAHSPVLLSRRPGGTPLVPCG